MTSFKKKIQKKSESHAYCQGVDAFQNGYTSKIVRSPYEEGSVANREWLDGFYDALYMRIITRGKYEL